MNESIDIDLQEALLELERFYSDELAPLMVIGAMDTMLRVPPSVAASGILAWTGGQSTRTGASSCMSDYYYHALKKLHLMGEFKLVPKEQLKAYLDELAQIVVENAPPEEQDSLRTSLARLGEVKQSHAAAVTLARRSDGAPQGSALDPGLAPGQGFSQEALRGVRRFTLLLERLRQGATPGAPAGHAAAEASMDQEALLSQILTTAAVNSHSSGDLNQFLGRLRETGLEAHTLAIFQALGRSLPGWVVPDAQAIPGAAAPVEAMRKIVSMARDSSEGATRFSELIRASIERFNEGALAQAAQMFDVAERLIADRKVDASVAQRIRDTAHERLSEERLGEYTKSADTHALLRRILGFFPAFSPRRLFDALGDEPKRERRRLLIEMLEVHGAPARTEALEMLRSQSDQMHFYLQRNLLHILRRIPRPGDALQEEELTLLSEYSRPRYEPIVAREAIAVLAQVKHERPETILLERLKEYERTLLAPGEARVDAHELQSTLDRIVASLARTGGTAAIRSLVEHGLSRKAPLGDTTARLTELAGRDLSLDPQSLKRLLEALKAELPRKMLGIVLPRNHEAAVQIIKALSGTPSGEVRRAFEEIGERYPEEALGEAATKALAGFAAPAREPETAPAVTLLSGDLGLFSLPNLLQSLADASVTGTLALVDPQGGLWGTIILETGRMRDCHVGLLHGEGAFYQLFEKPSTGTFTVKGRQAASPDATAEGTLIEIMPLLLEAMRRYDEYRSACALVPDNLAFRPTGSKPSRPQEESDTELLRSLWTMVHSGAMAAECEAKATVDSYRVRRILAHWLEEGALQPHQA